MFGVSLFFSSETNNNTIGMMLISTQLLVILLSKRFSKRTFPSAFSFVTNEVARRHPLPTLVFFCCCCRCLFLSTSSQTLSNSPFTGIFLAHLNENVPQDYTVIEKTLQNQSGNLNAGCDGSFRPYLAIQRKEGEVPLVDLGVVFQGSGEGVPKGMKVVEKSFSGQSGDMNPSEGMRDGKMKILIGYRKEEE